MPNHLTPAQVNELADAIVSGGLATEDARDDLLSNINRDYVVALPIRLGVLDQIKSDLNELNGVEYLVGGEVPLRSWLENGVHRLRRTFRPEQAVFQRILDEVASKSIATVPEEEPSEGLERVIHSDDLLDYSWLRGAMDVGAAVARIVVTRCEGGNVVTWPSTGKPVISQGTGWLIGPRHVITNHHVINARTESEPVAAESDLRRQVATARIQFDYDYQGAPEADTQVRDLSAWEIWSNVPALDYAILELAEPSTRTPLTMAPASLSDYQDTVAPVNIIQHPNGNPKAIGVRNNLTNELLEHELRYFTDTMRGSSGSPVCDDRWRVIALHRAEYRLNKPTNFQGKTSAWVNRGVRIDRIIDHLRSTRSELWQAIGASVA